MTRYLSFGYVPVYSWKKNIIGRFRGAENLIKRLQAPFIMKLIDIQPGEVILDFGCGGGFFTYEMARQGAYATGLDIKKSFPDIPSSFPLRLSFIQVAKGETLPFPGNTFDKIFLSDVLICLEKPSLVLKELNRCLRPGGKIYIVNTIGRKIIDQAYKTQPWWFRRLKPAPYFPASYDDYCAQFLSSDLVPRSSWPSADTLAKWIEEAGYSNPRVLFPFRYWPFAIISILQFRRFCLKNSVQVSFSVTLFLALSLIGTLFRRADDSNIVILATKLRAEDFIN